MGEWTGCTLNSLAAQQVRHGGRLVYADPLRKKERIGLEVASTPRVLITGGAGNLGRLCAAEFSAFGYEVGLFDRCPPGESLRGGSRPLNAYVGDLSDPCAIEHAFQDFRPEIVLHLGANPGPSDHPTVHRNRYAPTRSHQRLLPRDDTFKSNVLGTYYVLDSSVRAGVRRVVAASSACVLGLGFRISNGAFEMEYLPIDEAHPNRPEDSYSLSKHLNEEMYRAYARAYGIETVALRLLNVHYDEVESAALGLFRDRPLRPPARWPTTLWMYVDGRDAAKAFRLAAEATGLGLFEEFYIATGRTIKGSPKQYFQQYFPDLAAIADPLADWDDLVTIRKAQRLLGYEPQHFWLDAYPHVMLVTSD